MRRTAHFGTGCLCHLISGRHRTNLTPVGNSTKRNDAVPYDFGVPQRLGREATGGLRRIHETIARDLEQVLGTLFEHDVRGSVVSLEQTRYQQFIDALPARTYHGIVSSDALAGDCAVLLPGATALRFVDRLLGTSAGPERNLTIVDACLIEDYLPRLLGAITAAFDPYHPLGLSFNRSELNNQLVKLVPGDDVVVILEMLFTFGDDDITLIMCYPQDAIVPILASLSDMEREATAEALVRSSPMRRSILRVPIPVTVALPSTFMSAGDVSALAVGDILQTGIGADTAPVLSIAGRPALVVRPTIRRNRLACAVVGEPSNATKGLLQ